MNDERLIRAMRALDRPVEVDPGFEVELYAVLAREYSRTRQIVSRPNLLLVAALLAVAVVGLAIAVGSGLIPSPWVRPIVVISPAEPPSRLPSTIESWSRGVLPPGAGATAITARGSELFAVGNRSDGSGAAIWRSTDGRDWDETGPELLGGTSLVDVASGSAGVVAVGQLAEDVGAAWTSADGVTWARWEDPDFEDAWLLAVTAGGPGLVAVGTLPGGPQAWSSRDGRTWDLAQMPAAPPNLVLDTGRLSAYVRDVATVGDRLVAVGYLGLGDRPGATVETSGVFLELAIWTSIDGRAWTKSDVDPVIMPRGSAITGIASGPAGLVAVGTYSEIVADLVVEEPGIWLSTDGLAWRRAPADQVALTSDWPNGFTWGGMQAVATGPDGHVVVGRDGQCGGGACPTAEAAIWTSADGERWVRVPPGPDFRTTSGQGWVGADDVTAWGSRFAALGEWDGRSAAWISE